MILAPLITMSKCTEQLIGDAPWKCFSAGYQGKKAPDHPRWQDAKYNVWYRDPATVIKQLFDNPDFNNQFDYAPYIGLNKAGKRTWSDFMSGNSSWKHSVRCFILLAICPFENDYS